MRELIAAVAGKKAALDALPPLSAEALRALRRHADIELTYTSNAIEGNALTLRETAEVIEHGVTVDGRSLRDHLEALDHYDALLWTREIAGEAVPLGEGVVRELQRKIVRRSQPELAGAYSRLPRRIAGSAVTFPNALKIPDLMHAFGRWLERVPPTPEDAFEAHFRLTAIHPFTDGNGRTARLLMNLLLIRGGYPPVAVRPEDRNRYLAALEHASLHQDLAPFLTLLHQLLDQTLRECLEAPRETLPPGPGAGLEGPRS